VLLTEVYAAGEAPIVAPMAAAWRVRCVWPGGLSRCLWMTCAQMPQAIVDNARDGDVVLCMGAGSLARLLQKS
jgi:UDP-N-acetylmuramate--alanine ligase